MNERINEQTSHHEQEPKPKVLVTFHGYIHSQFNLQAVDHIGGALQDHLSKSGGKQIVFWELAGTSTRSSINNMKKVIKRRGIHEAFLVAQMTRTLNITPSEREIREKLDEISTTDLPNIIQKRLLPLDSFQSYFLTQELERLRQQSDFSFEMEAHSYPTVQMTDKLRKASQEAELRSHEHWTAGNFNESLENQKIAEQLQSEISRLRDHAIVDELKKVIRKLLKGKEGGSLFLLLGASHLPLVDSLQKKLGPNVPIKFESKIEIPHYSPALLVSLMTQDATLEEIPEELWARELFEEMLLHKADYYPRDAQSLAQYMKSYESMFSTISAFSNLLSLEEIRKLCEEKVDLVEYFRTRVDELSNSAE